MEVMDTVVKYSKEDFYLLQASLRELDISWVKTLETQILADKKIDQKYRANISDRKIYNVFNDIVRNRGWKVFIYAQACKLKMKLQKEQQ